MLKQAPKDEEKDLRSSQKNTNTDKLETKVNNNFSNWKRLFLLPYFPTWMYVVMVIGYFQACLGVYFSHLGYFPTELGIILVNYQGMDYYGDVLYLIDIILVTISKNIHVFICPMEIHYPNWILLLEFVSILPFNLIRTQPTNLFRAGLYYFIRYKNWLKCLRIINFFFYKRSLMPTRKIFHILVEYICYLCTGIFILFTVTNNLVMKEQNKKTGNVSLYFYISAIKISGYGIEEYPVGTGYLVCVICFGLGFFFLQGYFRVLCIWCVAERDIEDFKFRNKFHLIQTHLKSLNVSKEMIDRSVEFYKTSWKLKNIFVKDWKDLSVLPPSMKEEFSIEICWFAFKHSKLFGNFTLPFLRSLSMSMKSQVKIPGEILYDKGCIKDKMIYVESGIIQILSEEDDETPLFSLSGGTCIGESALILLCKSNTIVRCKTSCKLHILYQRDYNKIIHTHHEEFQQVRSAFYNRLNKAKEDRELSQAINKDYANERTNYVTVMWLKSTLHKLMTKDIATLEKHSCQNVFLRDEFDDDNFKNRHFTADNLDLIAISERLELVTDSVCLKPSFPCILQPNSFLVVLWNYCIAIVACVVGITVPFIAFVNFSVPSWFEIYIWLVTMIWWFDLYFQTSIAIKTPDKIIATVNSIFKLRICSISYVLDIVAAVPLEIFSFIILTTINRKNIVLLQLNRVFKLHKVIFLYKNWENKLTSRNIVVTFCWYQLCTFYIIYIFSSILFYFQATKVIENDKIYFSWCMFNVHQIINGASVFNSLSQIPSHYVFYGIICIVGCFIHIVYSISVISIYYQMRLNAIKLTSFYKNTVNTINSNMLAAKYKSRIMKNIQSQLQNTCIHDNKYFNFPLSIYENISKEMFEPLLCAIPFFKDLPKNVISKLNVCCKIFILPPNEVICCTGQILDYFIILESGYCKISSTTSSTEWIITAGKGISILEAYICKPVVNTIVTDTHCRIVNIARSDFLNALLDYPLETTHFESALSETNAKGKLSRLYHYNQTYSEYEYIAFSKKKKSFKAFGYHLELDSSEEYEYYIPFDRLQNFAFIQYFLMRFTIFPNSKFLLIWEVVRCLCSVASGIIFSLIYTNTVTDWYFFSVMLFLDAMAWADIYMRLHVCYYNNKGILVSHPLQTAKHYLNHGFTIDVLGVFPLKMFVPTKNPQVLTALQLNRFLQMYRYLCMSKIVYKKRTLHPTQTILLQYVPSILVLSFFLSFFAISSICTVTANSTITIKCVNDSWPVFDNFVDPLTPLRLQLYGVYLASGVITRPGIQGYYLHTTNSLINIATLTVIKSILYFYISCAIIKSFTTRTSSLWKYQNYMWNTTNFMKKYNVNISLRKKLISYFELKWFKFRDKNISTSMSMFQDALKQDILYDIYGKVLQKCPIFSLDPDSKHFFRNLLLELSHDIIINNGFAVKINDINEYINIIYKGKARVISADTTTICFLTAGSMFGNLIETQRSRQTVSVVAEGNIEILVVKTNKFYEILKKYNKLYNGYRHLMGFNVDYLKSKPFYNSFVSDNDESIEVPPTESKDFFDSEVFNHEKLCLQICRILILIIVGYLEAGFTLYQIVLGEYNLILVIIQYVCDALYIIYCYIKNTTRFNTNKEHKYFEIITLIPLDEFAWFLPRKIFRIVHSVLRFNRSLRFYFLNTYLKKLEKMLHSHSILFRMLRIFTWYTYVLHACSCVTLILSCSLTPNMNIPCNCSTNSTSSEKFEVYVSYFYIVFNIFSGSAQSQFYPISLALVVYFSILMITCAFFRYILYGQIYATIQLYYAQRNDYRKKIGVIINHLDQKQISAPLHHKISHYLQMLWRIEKGDAYPNLLLEAPYYLREAILNDAFSNYIDNNLIFTKCHRDFKRQVFSYLKTEVFFKENYVVFKGSANGCMYFIQDGTVQVINEDTHKRTAIKILRSGSYFGIGQGIFLNKPYLYSFKCLQYTTVLTLKFETWKHLLEFFPASRDSIYQQFFAQEDLYD